MLPFYFTFFFCLGFLQLYFYLSLFIGSAETWTQGLVLVRQVSYNPSLIVSNFKENTEADKNLAIG